MVKRRDRRRNIKSRRGRRRNMRDKKVEESCTPVLPNQNEQA